MIQIDTGWIFIFHFWFYIQLIIIFSSQFRLGNHKLSCFPLITSFHFIFHNFVSTWFLTVVFHSSLLIWSLLLCCPSSFSSKTSSISFWAVLFPSFLELPYSLFPSFLGLPNSLFPSFLGLPNTLFPSFLGLPNSLPWLCDMDASHKMLHHVWSVHNWPSLHNTLAGLCYPLQFCLLW